MKYYAIYKKGKVDRFFIKATQKEYVALLQNYFTVTSLDRPRLGRIYEMECLFSGEVWTGRQYHGFGYASCADVYGELIALVKKIFKNRLTQRTLAELETVNTHDDELTLSPETIEELSLLANEKLAERYGG